MTNIFNAAAINSKLTAQTDVIKEIQRYVGSYQEENFDGMMHSELETILSTLDVMHNQADDTSYSVSCLHEMLENISSTKRDQEEEENEKAAKEEREYLDSWWRSTRGIPQ